MPVNLRKIFPSISLKNFFGIANIKVETNKELTFENITEIVKNEMKEKINEEKMKNFIMILEYNICHTAIIVIYK